MLLLPGIIRKIKKVRGFFCLQDQRNSRRICKLGRLARSQNFRVLITFFRFYANTEIGVRVEEAVVAMAEGT